MDTDSFVYEVDIETFYKDIVKNVETKFHTRVYSKDDNRPLSIRTNKNIVGMMREKLDGKIKTESVALREKVNAYRKIDQKLEGKCCKDTKKFAVCSVLTFGDYNTCLFNGKKYTESQRS